ncbi:TetR/AcrR family transcriptional regulator [Chryseolinea lacunae]|uniref:TetR/AcrR family transcriptional regulator n=1 Tax=Chryseolinea lacunae TaxID=2801331 RepID=A0ABS1KPH1_9BACT|nr:TetR/AcrR family transcriptional regulator [Chryseolinea lacunae]MBL0741316.1 TetR/AcrR family transcriptional regulator [Chryseolinea lacunae]
MEEQDVKWKILKGAEGLFMRYGVRSISMDDIARHLTVSKKTLYQHFADKEDMVTMVCQVHLQEGQKEFDAIRANAENAIDELAGLSVCLKRNMEEINPSLLFDLQKYHPKAWALWQEFKRTCIYDSVKANLDQGIEEGFYRPELNSKILSLVRMATVEIAFDDHTFPQKEFNLTDVQMQLFDHFVHGIVTEKGKKLYEKYKTKKAVETPINQR